MAYNPEARVWRGKSYKKGGQSGKHRGSTIREEREADTSRVDRDLERSERDREVARGD